MKVNPLRSVGARLSLALLLVVAGSLALVYLVVIPSLESRLIDSKVHQLRKSVHSTLMGKGGVWSQDTGSTFYFASDARDAILAFAAGEGSGVLASHLRDHAEILALVASRERDVGGDA